MRTIPNRIAPAALALLLAWNCGPPPAPPGPGESRGAIPDLRGGTVMVFPVQLRTGVSQGILADSELAHALRSRGEGVTWVFPPEMDRILQRSPGIPAQIRGLPVRVFLQAEVNRVGDPLYGHLLRLAGLTGADVALIPVELKYGEDAAYLIAATLIATSSGRVIWYGVMEGDSGEAQSPAALASVAEMLARALLPFG